MSRRIFAGRGGDPGQALSDLIIEFYEKLSSWEDSLVTENGLTLLQMHTVEILGGNNLIKIKDLWPPIWE